MQRCGDQQRCKVELTNVCKILRVPTMLMLYSILTKLLAGLPHAVATFLAPSSCAHSALPASPSPSSTAHQGPAKTFHQTLSLFWVKRDHVRTRIRCIRCTGCVLRLAFLSACTPSVRCCGCQSIAGSLLRRGVSLYQDYPHRTTATCTKK